MVSVPYWCGHFTSNLVLIHREVKGKPLDFYKSFLEIYKSFYKSFQVTSENSHQNLWKITYNISYLHADLRFWLGIFYTITW